MSGFYSIDESEAQIDEVFGGPLDQGDAFDLVYKAGRTASDARNPGAGLDSYEVKSSNASKTYELLKGIEGSLSVAVPSNIYPKFNAVVPQMYSDKESKMWNEYHDLKQEAISKGLLKEEDFPKFGPIIDMELADKAAATGRDLYEATVRSQEYPLTTMSAELLSNIASNLDPQSNPFAVLHMAAAMAVPGAGSLAGVLALEGALGLAETAVEAPWRKQLADIYGERYGMSEFGQDALINMAFNAALPVGFRTLKRLPKTSVYKLLRSRLKRGSDLADEITIRTQAAEFADNPLNLLNDLSFPERVNRFNDGIARFTRAFLDGKTVGADGGILTQKELREILDIDTTNLTPIQKEFIADIKTTLDDLKDTTGIGEELFENGVVIRSDEGGLTVRTDDGEELPLLNATDANVLPDGAAIQFRRNKSKGQTKGAVDASVGDAVIPEIPKGKEYAELAPVQSKVKTSGTKLSGDTPSPAATSAGNTFSSNEPNPTDFPQQAGEVTPGGTVDSTSFGVDEISPTLQRQTEVLDETFSAQTLDNLAEELGRIDKDFEYVMEDGSVVDAGTFVKSLAISKRKADSLKVCGVGG